MAPLVGIGSSVLSFLPPPPHSPSPPFICDRKFLLAIHRKKKNQERWNEDSQTRRGSWEGGGVRLEPIMTTARKLWPLLRCFFSLSFIVLHCHLQPRNWTTVMSLSSCCRRCWCSTRRSAWQPRKRWLIPTSRNTDSAPTPHPLPPHPLALPFAARTFPTRRWIWATTPRTVPATARAFSTRAPRETGRRHPEEKRRVLVCIQECGNWTYIYMQYPIKYSTVHSTYHVTKIKTYEFCFANRWQKGDLCWWWISKLMLNFSMYSYTVRAVPELYCCVLVGALYRWLWVMYDECTKVSVNERIRLGNFLSSMVPWLISVVNLLFL